MKNKKGLSGIVTTLIIILLVLAAVALIWKPISNMIVGGTSDLEKSTLCTGVSMKVTKVILDGSFYNVTIERNAQGVDKDAGIKAVFFNAAGSSDVIDSKSGETWGHLRTRTIQMDAKMTDANLIKINPTFVIEDSGETVICDPSVERKITA